MTDSDYIAKELKDLQKVEGKVGQLVNRIKDLDQSISRAFDIYCQEVGATIIVVPVLNEKTGRNTQYTPYYKIYPENKLSLDPGDNRLSSPVSSSGKAVRFAVKELVYLLSSKDSSL